MVYIDGYVTGDKFLGPQLRAMFGTGGLLWWYNALIMFLGPQLRAMFGTRMPQRMPDVRFQVSRPSASGDVRNGVGVFVSPVLPRVSRPSASGDVRNSEKDQDLTPDQYIRF